MTIVSINVVKPKFFNILEADNIKDNVEVRDVARTWREFNGHHYADRQQSERSSHCYIYAILDNGDSVQCQHVVERSDYHYGGFWHKPEVETVGSLELPKNWVEIHYSEWSYHHSQGGIIARKNADGKTATVFPLLNY